MNSDYEVVQGKAKAPQTLDYVRELLRFGRLAQVGDTVYGRRMDASGWTDVTDLIKRRATNASGKCARRSGIMSALEPFIAVPTANSETCTPYCCYRFVPGEEDMGDAERFNGAVHQSHWRPLMVSTDDVVFADGRYNIKTGHFQGWDGDQVFGPTLSLRYEEVRTAKITPQFEDFAGSLLDAMPDPDTLLYFRKTMSCILQPHVPQKMGIFFVGPTGARKSTIATALLCAPAGVAGYSIEPIDELADDRFAQANLIGKFANLSDDPDGQSRKWVAWFKRYTGQSIQRGEFKFVQSRSYPATAKLLICCNRLPRMGDESDAVWARIQVFNFARAGGAGRAYDEGVANNTKLGVPFWSDYGTRCRVVHWLLEGLKMRQKEGMAVPEQVKEWNLQAIAASDPIRTALYASFMRTDDKDSFVSTQEILDAAKLDGVNLSGSQIALYMKSCFKADTSTQNVKDPNGATRQVRGYRGVGRKP